MGVADAADYFWMLRALALAKRAANQGEVPVGAVLIRDQQILGEGFNQPIQANDPSAHAEIVTLRQAAARAKNYRLPGTALYVTLEPCAMCAGALIQARVDRVVFAAGDSRNGACGTVFNVLQNPTLNHRAEVTGGILADESRELLKNFFRVRRLRSRS